MPLLFSLTLFCSAFLLFQVQPMVGKMLLPGLGGTPAVWNACMVFFQAALLAGYTYAHATSAALGSRRQSLLHLGALLLPLLALPIVIPGDAFRSAAALDNPVWMVLTQLAVSVGLPFLVVSTTAPLLQRWFADTGHPSAKDPYFLYAASNFGSMLALIAYPIFVEPNLPLGAQSRVWTWGYIVYAALVGVCGLTLWLRPRPAAVVTFEVPPEPIGWPRRLRWVALAFVPSSLLLGVTTYISTDIAPIPLLWVIPLALYLLTFIIVFSRRPLVPHRVACRLLPGAAVVLSLVLVTGATDLRGLPIWVLLGIHLLAFFLAALVGHGELVRDRPSARHLTEFYLWMSIGGVLGGLFNTLLAPLLFRHAGLAEYPQALVLACLLRPWKSKPLPADFLLPLVVGAFAAAMVYLGDYLNLIQISRTAVSFGVPCALVYAFVDRPVRFALGIAALLLAGAIHPQMERLFNERNFFGVVKVVDMHPPEGGAFRALFHGNTIHGQMDLENTDADGRREPLTYYHRSGPIGHVCTKWFEGRPEGQRIAAVGLGTGSLAYYARPGDRWLFYEIDPIIQRVAEDPRYFTFMGECRAGKPEVILGDAYLRLQEAPEGSFDMLILDAFSSDAIPVHLLTREALELYRTRLKKGGILAFHVSNRYLNLRPILARLADDADWVARGWRDVTPNKPGGKLDSEWIIMAAGDGDFGPIVWSPTNVTIPDPRWKRTEPGPRTPLWTNDFSNLLSAFGRDEDSP